MTPRDRTGAAIPRAWQERRELLQGLDAWRMEGRLAIRTGRGGYNGTASWEQADQHLDFRFRGPFGFGGFRIHGDEGRLHIKATGREDMILNDPERDMQAQFGWSLPVYSMRHWMVGVPDPDAPAEETLDGQGRLTDLQQKGWQLRYDGYQTEAGLQLPRKIVMEHGPVTIRVVADRWQVEAPDDDGP